MNKKWIIFGAAGMLVTVAIVAVVLLVVFTREGVIVQTGFTSSAVSYVKNDTWTTTAKSVNGHYRVDKTLDAGNLAAFQVSNKNNSGTILLVLTQGDIEKTVDITGSFNDKINMGEFTPGRIRMKLVFENANDLAVSVGWK